MRKVDARADGGVGFLELNNPPVNALTPEVFDDLMEGLEAYAKDASVRVSVITGKKFSDRPAIFSAGANIKMLRDLQQSGRERAREVFEEIHRKLLVIDESPKPVIAAVDGVCFGGGFELALACDAIVASPGAEFRLPEVTLGIIPGWGGTQRLARIIGYECAASLIVSGRLISAIDASDLSIASCYLGTNFIEGVKVFCKAAKVADRSGPAVADGAPDNQAMRRDGAGNPLLAVAKAAAAIKTGLVLGTLRAGLAAELEQFLDCLFSDDGIEGIAAFLEKRKPNFSIVLG